jgi:hypothetical protein
MDDASQKMQSNFSRAVAQLVEDNQRIFRSQEAQHKRREEYLVDQVGPHSLCS